MSSTERLYKIMTAERWAQASGSLPSAPIDERDGYIHLSDASQVRETARLHFAGQTDLVLIELDPARLSEGTLRRESSRGGQLFPHVYGDVPMDASSVSMRWCCATVRSCSPTTSTDGPAELLAAGTRQTHPRGA